MRAVNAHHMTTFARRAARLAATNVNRHAPHSAKAAQATIEKAQPSQPYIPDYVPRAVSIHLITSLRNDVIAW